jgi:glycogen operon protein
MFNGKTLGVMDEEGNPVVDDSFLILVNASDQGVEYTLPGPPDKTPWRQVLDTENIDDPFCEAQVGEKVIVGGRAVRVYSDGVEKTAEAPMKKRPATTL